MTAHTRQANARQPNCDTKPDTHNENRITKAKRNGTSSALSDLAKTIAKAENSSSASTTSVPASGATVASGQAVYSRNLESEPSATEPKDTTTDLSSNTPRTPLAHVQEDIAHEYDKFSPHAYGYHRSLFGARSKLSTGIMASRNPYYRSAHPAATAAVPRKIQHSASASNTQSSKAIEPRIPASKPSAPVVSGRTESSMPASLKRRAASADQESGRAVRPKVARNTSHIVRANSASDGETSAASQETFVEPLSSCPIASNAESGSTVVDQGVPADIIRRKIAQPGPAFSSRYLHRIPYPFEKDFDADERYAANDDTEPDWDDIDAEDANDPSMVTEYVDDIIKYLRARENEFIPDDRYMDKQVELDWTMRHNLVEWIVIIHSQLEMLPETLFHAVNLIDRYLSKRQTSTTMLHLVGLTALLIACKYEERKSPSFDDLVNLSENAYTVDDFKHAEAYMLRTLNFDLSYPGPFTFLQRASKAGRCNVQTRTVAKYIMEVCIMDHRLLDIPPSLFAAAGICLARRMLDAGPWDGNLRYYSGYTEAELQPCINIALDHIRKSPDDEYINRKYMAERFFKCSKICKRYAMKNAYRLDFSAPIGDVLE